MRRKISDLVCGHSKVISSQVSTLEEEIEELRRKFEASKKSRSSKSDSFGHFDEGRGSRYVLLSGWLMRLQAFFENCKTTVR